MVKHRKEMPPEEFVRDVGGIALWLFLALLLVLATGTLLEALATF